MKCEICGRELAPGEGFVRLEAYVAVGKDVFRESAGSPGVARCVLCLPAGRAVPAGIERVSETWERRER